MILEQKEIQPVLNEPYNINLEQKEIWPLSS